MTRRLSAAAAVLLVLALLMALRVGVGVGNYSGENERLLRSLPAPTGAERTLADTSASEGEGGVLTAVAHLLGGPAANGWITRWEFRVPEGTTAAQVLQAYEVGMVADGWTATERCCGGVSNIIGFTRGEQGAVVNVDNLAVGRYELSVDAHSGATRRHEIGQ